MQEINGRKIRVELSENELNMEVLIEFLAKGFIEDFTKDSKEESAVYQTNIKTRKEQLNEI